MNYVSSDNSIDILPLSVRSFNALKAERITTVGAFMSLSENEIIKIKNLGTTSKNEIIEIQSCLKDGSRGIFFVNPNNSEANVIDKQETAITEDSPIEFLGLSVRSYNCLMRNNITTVAKLGTLSYDDLLQIRNLGVGSANEILQKIAEFQSKLLKQMCTVPDVAEITIDYRIEETVEALFHELKQYLIFDVSVCKSLLLTLTKSFCVENNQGDIIQSSAYIKMIFSHEYFENIGLIHVVKVLEKYPYGITVPKIMWTLPQCLYGLGIVESWLIRLAKNKTICYIENGVKLYKPQFMDFVNSITDERAKSVLLGRAANRTLEELGSLYGITRERIRQIETKWLKKCPPVEEDRYRKLFETYELGYKNFFKLTDEPYSTFYYLEYRYECGVKPLHELIGDNDLDIELRKRADRMVYNNYIYLGNDRVEKKRDNIITYVLRTYFANGGLFNEFLRLYEELLKENGLYEVEALQITSPATFSNKFANMNTVLWKQNQKLRYYNIAAYDFTQLLDGLNLSQYQDVEFSTRRFFLDNPELMKMYDIRDEYELHNLLKKITIDVPNMTFHRMPTIEFGKANRASQVLDLLIELAPVSIDDLTTAYEDQYGVRPETIKANYLKEFDEYYHDGKYIIDTPPLSLHHHTILAKYLTGDFYLYSEIRDKYISAVSDADTGLINPYTIKGLGFRAYSNYAVKNTFASASDCFGKYLFDPDIVDLRLLPKGMTQTISFSSLLAKAKAEYQIVEFANKQFVNIRRLKRKGITEKNLCEYCDSVYNFTLGQVYFTIKSLRQCGFNHPLHTLGFDDIFYSCLLSQDKRFATNSFGRNRVFAKDESSFQAIDFFESILIERRSIDIYDFQALLAKDYGIHFDNYKIREISEDSTLYYDKIMEKIYINYDLYFEEV